MNLRLTAPRWLFAVAVVIFTAVTLVAPVVSAGEERVSMDVNQPHNADVDEWTEDADFIVRGTVVATDSPTGGRMLRQLNEVSVTHARKAEPPEVLEVVQEVGSANGAVHIEGQLALEVGSDYVLFLGSEGQHFRTVGEAQGISVPSRSGWVSAAPSRAGLALGSLDAINATSQAGLTVPPLVTVPSPPSATRSDPTRTMPGSTASPEPSTTAPPVIDGPSATPLEPGESEPRDAAAEESGPRTWLLALTFCGGLALGATATALALNRRRARAPAGPRPDARSTPGLEDPTVQPSAVPTPESRATSDSALAAVQGLIAVADLTDSPVLLAQLERSLRQAGVEMVTATEGQPFDPAWHHGVGTLPAPRPELDLTVARAVRPGWRSADGLLRPVEVEVYRSGVL